MLEEQPLDAARHDRAGFNCGVLALDDYLKLLALQHAKKGIAVVRVLVDTARPEEILGYYTLGAAQIDVAALDEKTKKQLPRFPVPCFRMGRLACSTAHQGKGIGRMLVGLAVARCIEAKTDVAAYALIVDAKDSQAKAFYEHYGFTACRDKEMTLYLPLGNAGR